MQRTKSLENLKKSNRLVKVELQKKKMPHFAHFPRPGESDLYVSRIPDDFDGVNQANYQFHFLYSC